MPGRVFNAASYRYGYNGKENDNEVKGAGNQQDYGMRIYDTRVGRFLSIDPIQRDYPWYTPYQFAGNNPIKFIDIDGLEPGVKGKVRSGDFKYTNEQLKQSLNLRSASIHSGISIDYMITAARQEGLSLTMYDADGDKRRGGNATIGFGSLIHLGSIGNTYYDKDALQKETKFKNGVTYEQAVDMFIQETNENAKDLQNWFLLFKIDKSIVAQTEMDVIADIYFNSGTSNVKTALGIYKLNGKQGLINCIKNGTISSASEKRKNFRLQILENGVYEAEDSSKKTRQKPPEDIINYEQPEIEKNYKNLIPFPNVLPS